ncbi:hypothetical protein CA267_009000 [Alteromonas pelagimontana]|uniref:Uncharacterized protein n=1 Tax=Alteromonas pelagimontana TaxID=1858656 RepID=A0A6M4MFF9_9ALTE|nr:hypothetical protein [Alteromonas pelagimontana]QJR80906.1 hypothetical protein CA267_009000 [Alteromonas pelagimontana]
MKTTFLCPGYWKWLQLHPNEARIHRLKVQEQAQQLQAEGNFRQAQDASGQAFEIAHAVILSPQELMADVKKTSEDFVAYGALAIYLAQSYVVTGNLIPALDLLGKAQEQLMALSPLFFTQPTISRLIQAIIHSLYEGSVHFEQQTMPSTAVH